MHALSGGKFKCKDLQPGYGGGDYMYRRRARIGPHRAVTARRRPAPSPPHRAPPPPPPPVTLPPPPFRLSSTADTGLSSMAGPDLFCYHQDGQPAVIGPLKIKLADVCAGTCGAPAKYERAVFKYRACEDDADCGNDQFCSVSCHTDEADCETQEKVCQPCNECHHGGDAVSGKCRDGCGGCPDGGGRACEEKDIGNLDFRRLGMKKEINMNGDMVSVTLIALSSRWGVASAG